MSRPTYRCTRHRTDTCLYTQLFAEISANTSVKTIEGEQRHRRKQCTVYLQPNVTVDSPRTGCPHCSQVTTRASMQRAVHELSSPLARHFRATF